MVKIGAALGLSALLTVALAAAAAVAIQRGPVPALERLAGHARMPSLAGAVAPPGRTTTTSEGVVKELRALDRLETAAFTAETIVESDNPGNLLQNLLYRDRMLLLARGRVVAGVDLAHLS